MFQVLLCSKTSTAGPVYRETTQTTPSTSSAPSPRTSTVKAVPLGKVGAGINVSGSSSTATRPNNCGEGFVPHGDDGGCISMEQYNETAVYFNLV